MPIPESSRLRRASDAATSAAIAFFIASSTACSASVFAFNLSLAAANQSSAASTVITVAALASGPAPVAAALNTGYTGTLSVSATNIAVGTPITVTETATKVFRTVDEAVRYFLDEHYIAPAPRGGLFA